MEMQRIMRNYGLKTESKQKEYSHKPYESRKDSARLQTNQPKPSSINPANSDEMRGEGEKQREGENLVEQYRDI